MPVVPASESVWQPPQFVVKTTLPAAASPAGAGGVGVVSVVSVVDVGTLPSTVSGVAPVWPFVAASGRDSDTNEQSGGDGREAAHRVRV